MADFESIIKSHCGEDGSIPADAIGKLAKAISTTVGNEFVDKTRYKAKLDEIDELNGKLQTAEDSVTTAEKWKVKYEAAKQDLATFKSEQAKKDARAAKVSAYRALAKEAGVREERIDTLVNVMVKTGEIDALELDDSGAAKEKEKYVEGIKTEWADFIPVTHTEGAPTATPPANTGGGHKMTKEEIMNIKDIGERQKAMLENSDLFGI